MSLRIRRGTEAQRLGITPDMGEIIWTTNGEKLYVGDGVTVGGKDIAAQLAGTGLVYNGTTGKLDSAASYTTDQITEGVNNKYFSQELAQDAIGAAITAGTQSGITVTYTDNGAGAGSINFSVTPDGVGITDIVSDTTPQLGGNLDLNSRSITGTGNVDITGDIDITGTITATTGLGANLVLNGNDVTGTGNINITGNVTATRFIGDLTTAGGATVLINRTTRAATLSRIVLDTNGSITTPALLIDSPAVSFVAGTVSLDTPFISCYVASSTSDQTGSLALVRSRGTPISPAVVVNGDEIGSIVSSAFSGSQFTLSTDIVSIVDGTVSAGVVPSRMDLRVTNQSGVTATAMSVKPNEIDFTVPPKLPVIASDAARSSLISTPTKGMMILMEAGTTPAATNVVQVYNGSDWVNLH